jgi:hypothetical protein
MNQDVSTEQKTRKKGNGLRASDFLIKASRSLPSFQCVNGRRPSFQGNRVGWQAVGRGKTVEELFYKKVFFLPFTLFLFTFALSQPLAAAPTLTVGSATGQAGKTVDLSIAFDPGAAQVSGAQFDLTLPSALSVGPVAPGAILKSTGKSVNMRQSGRTCTFIIFGMNQFAIPSGTLLTAQVTIAPGTGNKTLNVPLSKVFYSNAKGNSISSGSGASGKVVIQ